MNTVKVKRLRPDAYIPVKAHPDDACFDIIIPEGFKMQGKVEKIPTGLAFEVPKGFALKVIPRSGWSLKGIKVANSPGTIDSNYRGELFVIIDPDKNPYVEFKTGDKIAQCELTEVIPCEFVVSEELSETDRGANGLGSTGR